MKGDIYSVPFLGAVLAGRRHTAACKAHAEAISRYYAGQVSYEETRVLYEETQRWYLRTMEGCSLAILICCALIIALQLLKLFS